MKRKIILLVTIILIILLTVLILFSENIKSIKIIENLKNNIINISKENENNDSITTIDVTGITAGKETEHEHIYKTMYDPNKHWEECKACGEKRNESIHSYTTTWAMGYESCDAENICTKACACGYSEKGHRPCVWDGSSYQNNVDWYYHVKKCNICGIWPRGIKNSYYLNYYGNGQTYDATINGKYAYYIDGKPSNTEYCYKSDGSIINC